MKKIVLLFTIACIGQLYGMEPIEPSYKSLPKELQQEIITQALAVSNDPFQAIEMIEKFSILHGVQFDNIKDFTKLVHILADKFNVSAQDIAYFFETPVSQKYRQLFNTFLRYLRENNLEDIKKSIAQGVDIFSSKDGILPWYLHMMVKTNNLNPLHVKQPQLEIIKLLLANGADPNAKWNDKTALDYLNEYFQNAPVYEQIKALLEKAMHPPSH